jgi:hypothetical protein
VKKKKIKANCEQIILNFKLIFNNKNHSKLNMSIALSIKNMKPNPKNPTNQGLSCSTKNLPQFPSKNSSDFLEFSFTIFFNIQ